MSIKTLEVPMGQIKGLMQGVDESLLSLSYSPDCANISVEDGTIKTHKGTTYYIDPSTHEGTVETPDTTGTHISRSAASCL